MARFRQTITPNIGATHMAIATHNAGPTDVDGHLARIAEYRDALAS